MTKTLFIPLIKKEKLNKSKLSLLDSLPNTIYIAYIIQYKKIAEQAKEYLIKAKKKIIGFSQVLGCSELKSRFPVLLISDGKFHASNLLKQGNQVYLFDNYYLIKLEKPNKKTTLTKLYSAKKLGILISTKQGQYNIKSAELIKNKLNKQNKKTYLFLADNINIIEFENFNIDFWVNTACPGLSLDNSNILNFTEI